ncbi:MAG: hypothetical protein HZC54_09735 [Verrucomicrobia bacterium]|nr:hypothetical protein [Verrucomicrobiota bacterium]
MKKLIVLFVFCGMILPLAAQMVPVQLDVKPVSRKRGTGGGVYYSNVQTGRALQITIQNTSPKPVTGVTVRWGVVKTRSRVYSSDSQRNWRERAFGAEEKLDLKPREQKVIETAEVAAAREESHFDGWMYGEKIIGHGVQVLINDKVVLENFVPPSPAIKKALEKLYPIEEEEEGSRKKKSKP